jgi:hypothetical protein
MNLIMQDGRVFRGSKRDIVEQMRSSAFSPHASLEAYIVWCADRAGLALREDTPEALVDAMLKAEIVAEKGSKP